MSGEATPAELNEASEITMEGSGDVVIGQDDENGSLFGEVVPDIKDPREVEDPAPSLSLEDKEVLDTGKPPEDVIVDPVKVDKEVIPEEPDALTKLTEHKTNLEKALNASRAEIKSLKFLAEQQKIQPPAPVNDQAAKVDPDFKVLSKAEFEELKGESAVDALQYMHDLNAHKDALVEEAKVNEQVTATNNLIANSLEAISLAIPGVYEDQAVGQKLTDYAIEQGFDNDSLSILSNPATRVLLPGTNTPVPLGKTAVDFVKFCNGQMNGSDNTQLRAEIEKEVTARVTKDLLSKFKNNPTGVGLDEVPTANSGSPSTFVAKGEAELRKMSEQERDDYYQGK